MVSVLFVTLPVNFAAVDVEPPVLILVTALEVGKEPAPQCMYLAVPEAAEWVTDSTYLMPFVAVASEVKEPEPPFMPVTKPAVDVPEAAVWVTASTYGTPPSAVVFAPKLTEPFGVIETLPEAAVPVKVEVTVPAGV